MGSPSIPKTQSHSRIHRQLRSRFSISILLTIALILALQFTVLPRYLSEPSPAASRLSTYHLDRLDAGFQKCVELNTKPAEYAIPPSASRENPRWNPNHGQNQTVILKNARLFDGETFVGDKDIKFSNGVVISVTNASLSTIYDEDTKVLDLDFKYVTPGLVDMHSHHLVGNWPNLDGNQDSNEINDATGPLTPFVRALDSIKVYDLATKMIAAGGITSSLILPGSANIMGGEGFMVKNTLKSGLHAEQVAEDLLLEHGIPTAERRRYIKMACGENPRRVYTHTRMGNAYIFRHHMERAKELVERQNLWCLSAAAARESGDRASIAGFLGSSLSGDKGRLPEELELDSSAAILRGKIGVNVHCYEPEDFEDMILHSKEFGFRIQAFHHALSAWKVPEMLKDSGENITIATFSTFGLYKKEAYDANLWAGKILSDHGVPVAYKSDHGTEALNARYLMFQAATAASFHLPKDLALQSVTSVPAKSLGLDHRIGYVRLGYDADLVVWDEHPLSVGATPLQVYIDGRPTLDPEAVKKSLSDVRTESSREIVEPKIRPILSLEAREKVCAQVEHEKTIITGIRTSYLKSTTHLSIAENLTLVLDKGKIACFSTPQNCLSYSSSGHTISLENGHISPGATVLSTSLGLSEIMMEDSTGDGNVSPKLDPLNPDNVLFAKYGVHLEGRAFQRAKYGGVTRAVTVPMMGFEGGFLTGVSVGIKTSGRSSILDGGIFKSDVALHFMLGQASKNPEFTPTISSAVAALRKILQQNEGKDNIYGAVANGSLPLVVHAVNKYSILQLISLSQSFPSTNLILYGAAEAPLVATELAAAKIPVILTSTRPAPDTFEKLNVITGPPLSRSPAAVLLEAGVRLAISIANEGPEGDSHIHNTLLEAGWVGKFAGLSDHQAVGLVSWQLEEILGLSSPAKETKSEEVMKEYGDFVVWEGRPLGMGASVVLTVDAEDVVACWPDVQ